MVVWKVTCHWYDRESTEIGIFTSRPLAARAAISFIKSMNRRCGYRYLRIMSELWDDCISISEYDLLGGYSYEFADIYFTEVVLNEGLTY